MAFQNLPDDSRVWIYGFDKKLKPDEVILVNNRLQQFVETWKVHGSSVAGGFELLEDQFILIATNDAVSGCSIDSSVAVFKELKQLHGLDALNQNMIFFRNENKEVQTVTRNEFQQLVKDGAINQDSQVFNLMLNTYGQVKENSFELAFSESWHSKVFKLPQEALP